MNSSSTLPASSPQLATLCYILDRDRVLLIRKKRGIGAGKINAPGGKADPGESALDAAVRETQEEVGVTPLDLKERGELEFAFADGLQLRCIVFLAEAYEGEPHETAEAIPLWFPLDAMPWEQMWNDDAHWLPLLFAGHRFRGRAVVTPDGQSTTDREIEVVFEGAKPV